MTGPQNRASAATADFDENPFAARSALPYGAPPFDRIDDADYEPAIEEGMRRHLAEIEAIAGDPAPPTFENTLVALERSGELLTRVLKVFGAVTSANVNDVLQDVQTRVAPRLAAHHDAIYLDARLFARVRRVYESRDLLGLSDEGRHLVQRYHLEFVRAGARLSESDKERLRALNLEESTLTNEFQNRLLAANKAAAVVVTDREELEGLSEADVSAAASAAAERGLAGGWVLRLQNTTQQPWLESLRRRGVRERVFRAAETRAERGDANDTRAIITRLAELRAERARLLGYENAAAYALDDQMAKSPQAAMALLTQLGAPAVAKAKREAARMQAIIDADGPRFALEPWDWQHYAERVRRAEYDLDESQLKPYFSLERVVRDGVFFAASRLYGIRFEPRHDIPVYHPDVQVYEVFDADGSPLALFYADFYKRDNKSGGAWMDSFVDQSRLLGERAVVYNACNFNKPAAGQPVLLTFDDVTTLFHEFGHTLHGMLSDVEFPMLSGTAVPRDFVEFPSQFNEHWAIEPTVFANYARHYQTGEPMPPELYERIRRARTFNQGYALSEYIAAAMIDMAWHSLPAGPPPDDVAAFEDDALRRRGMLLREVPPRYHTPYFAHIWDGGYDAGYYAYLWAEVLDHDAYAWFLEQGGMTRANGDRFRQMILARGGTADPAELYRAFRGREPRIEPLVAERGLTLPEPGT
ncbi:MAG TPA: M3 family metallopeptidase [Gemmatimonadaceae bacterium]|nr:M3 family metallopeptidase [Gemmatimonadaceae bacterium]